MPAPPIAKADDGFYHPSTEDELIALVKMAQKTGLQLRVRGSAHSVACAIYTDPCTPAGNHVTQQSPPDTDNVNVRLDRYRQILHVDTEARRATVQAGINLGKDPSDPTSTLANSFLYQLWTEHDLTVSDLGGIIHQTVSGFTQMGCSGGSTRHSINQNLHAIRLIDGTGEVYTVSRDDEDPSLFDAAAVGMGLLGVVSEMTFQLVDGFDISGQEAITTVLGAEVDLFGEDPDRPSLGAFLDDTEYARLEWWPQRGTGEGGGRLLTWQCEQIPRAPGFVRHPYEEFGDHPEVTEFLEGLFLTIIGNLDDPSAVKRKLEDDFDQVERVLEYVLAEEDELGALGVYLARFLKAVVEFGVDLAITIAGPFLFPLLKRDLPEVMAKAVKAFIPLDVDKKGDEKGEPQRFQDDAWQGLAMDNQADDYLVGTEFTELWVPLGRTDAAMRLLRDYFEAPDSDHEALERTGTFAWELYAARPTPFWMSPSHTDGEDEWKDGVLRIDAYWFKDNAGNPAEVFYPQFWDLFRKHDIPFRLHWAKFHPVLPPGDPDGWVPYFRGLYPKWDDFLAVRAEKDPDGVFLTGYWRERFGLPAA